MNNTLLLISFSLCLFQDYRIVYQCVYLSWRLLDCRFIKLNSPLDFTLTITNSAENLTGSHFDYYNSRWVPHWLSHWLRNTTPTEFPTEFPTGFHTDCVTQLPLNFPLDPTLTITTPAGSNSGSVYRQVLAGAEINVLTACQMSEEFLNKYLELK